VKQEGRIVFSRKTHSLTPFLSLFLSLPVSPLSLFLSHSFSFSFLFRVIQSYHVKMARGVIDNEANRMCKVSLIIGPQIDREIDR